jgi:hypothetical protein
MRAKILRLVRLREIRRDSSRRSFSQARDELQARERTLAALAEERRRLERDTLGLMQTLARDGSIMTSADLASLQRGIAAGRIAIGRIEGRIEQARSARETAAAAMREAAKALRLAEQSLDQIGILDARLAEEEQREFEQQEEAESERIPRAVKPGSLT